MKVLIINGHPREQSFSSAISNTYIDGAENADVIVKYLPLFGTSFNLNVTHASPKQQVDEPVIENAREMILWADHLVFIYPTWWGTMPALLKGFIDRTFTEGFAFEETEGGTGYLPLLGGRTAEIITTMDTPRLIYHLIYRAPGHNAMRRSILEFCGFEISSITSFGPVKSSTGAQRQRWLAKIRQRAQKLKNGALSPLKKLKIKTFSWFRAIRFQFYPMTLVAYAAGAWAANSSGYVFNSSLFWIGYGWLFFLEIATVLTNEYVDYATDKNNHYFGPFTGGSRVIVDKSLSFPDIKKGIIISFVLALTFLLILLYNSVSGYFEITMAALILTVLAIGYTAPPLKLAYRGLGELTVSFTHSFAVIVCGYLFMGGGITDTLPWVLGIPLFLAVLPSITLSGIPDYEADKSARKRTLAVRFGRKAAASIALTSAWLSLIVLISFIVSNGSGPFDGILFFAVPNVILLTILIRRYSISPELPKRIDGLMAASLVYIIWYGLIPLINLWN